MNRSYYDYNVIDPAFPQVVRRDAKGGNSAHLVTKTEFWRVVTALASARPNWWFTLYGYENTNCGVWCDNEDLGELDYDSHSKMFGVASPAIRNTLERKKKRQTKDPKKFLKLVITNVKQTPMFERWEKAASTAFSHLNSISANARSAAWYNLASNQNSLLGFMANHAKEFESFNPAFKSDTFLSKLEKHIEADRLANLTKLHGACLLIKLGGGHYAIRKEDGVWEPCTDSTLPSNLAEPLGALKLMDSETLMHNYGYRHDNDTFIVIPKDDEPCE
jgi:hypothetical protein